MFVWVIAPSFKFFFHCFLSLEFDLCYLAMHYEFYYDFTGSDDSNKYEKQIHLGVNNRFINNEGNVNSMIKLGKTDMKCNIKMAAAAIQLEMYYCIIILCFECTLPLAPSIMNNKIYGISTYIIYEIRLYSMKDCSGASSGVYKSIGHF